MTSVNFIRDSHVAKLILFLGLGGYAPNSLRVLGVRDYQDEKAKVIVKCKPTRPGS